MHSFLYDNEHIEYELKDRKTDNGRILIKVHPSCKVVVLAPKNTSSEDVLAAVKKRSRWVYNQLQQFKSQLEYITPRNYMGGESHYYLGKQYLLKVITTHERQAVKLLRGKLEVSLSPDTAEQSIAVKLLLGHWYKMRARQVFASRLEAVSSQALWVAEPPSIRIQAMKKQWGSCSPQGRLTLNVHLVKAPRECIDYVILHELCHLAEHNHSPRFYRLMSEVMPQWEEVKEQLDGMAEVILNGSLRDS